MYWNQIIDPLIRTTIIIHYKEGNDRRAYNKLFGCSDINFITHYH